MMSRKIANNAVSIRAPSDDALVERIRRGQSNQACAANVNRAAVV